jgi:hypothetical protein
VPFPYKPEKANLLGFPPVLRGWFVVVLRKAERSLPGFVASAAVVRHHTEILRVLLPEPGISVIY